MKASPFTSPVRQRFDAFLPTGFASLDHFLGGGWLKGALTVITGKPGSGKTTLALQCAARLTRDRQMVVLVSPKASFFPPALHAAGVRLSHLLWLRPSNEERCRWAVEQVTRSGLFPLVLVNDVTYTERPARRLQLAAETGGVVVLFLMSAEPHAHPWAFALRCQVERKTSDTLEVAVLRSRKHLPQTYIEVPLYEKDTNAGDSFSDSPSPRVAS